MNRAILSLSLVALTWLNAMPRPPAGMAFIPGGPYSPPFTKDAKDAKPRAVEAFFLDNEPATNAQFLEFVRANPQWRRSRIKAVFADPGYLKQWTGDLEPGAKAPSDAPVIDVSWFAARAFLKAHGKRLPTTDEWEFAARASSIRADATSEATFAAKILAWYARPTPEVLPAVQTAEPDVHGVRGLHGLIWEWVADFNNAMSTGEGRDQESMDRNFFCGAGALGSPNPGNYAAFMRFAFRSSLQGSYCVANLGFRGARSLPTP